MKLALKRVLTLLMWVFLGLFAYYVIRYIAPIAFLIGLFSHFFKRSIGEGFDSLALDLKNINISLDQLGNVTIFNWLWFLFKTKEGYKFGDPDETISYVLKVNYDNNTLKFLGRPLYLLIDKLDPGHFNNLTG